MRTTFQLAADLPDSGGATAGKAFTDAAHSALRWLAPKCPELIPESAWRLEGFELGHPGLQQLQCVSVPERGLWSVRLVEPSAPFRNRPAVAGRTWRTDLALHQGEGGVRFGVRLACVSTSYAADEPVDLTRPGIVLDLARRSGLREIRPLDGRPWMLETEDDLRALHNLLTDPRRTMPVVMLTPPNPGELPRALEYLLDQGDLARRTQGLAHVVCMSN